MLNRSNTAICSSKYHDIGQAILAEIKFILRPPDEIPADVWPMSRDRRLKPSTDPIFTCFCKCKIYCKFTVKFTVNVIKTKSCKFFTIFVKKLQEKFFCKKFTNMVIFFQGLRWWESWEFWESWQKSLGVLKKFIVYNPGIAADLSFVKMSALGCYSKINLKWLFF